MTNGQLIHQYSVLSLLPTLDRVHISLPFADFCSSLHHSPLLSNSAFAKSVPGLLAELSEEGGAQSLRGCCALLSVTVRPWTLFLFYFIFIFKYIFLS